jgi:tRNA threonylcarbamoyl adenosine modification protein YeaZ
MELAIDSATDEPAVALARDGIVAYARTWRTERNHSVELLPAIEELLAEAGIDRTRLTAVFVDIGPGGYAALRVGLSIAKALAHALAVPLAGIGRLELDAWRARAAGRRVVAVHRAGRDEYARAVYEAAGGWREASAPQIGKIDALRAALSAGDAVTGDIDDAVAEAARAAGAAVVEPDEPRVRALAALGNARLAAGRADDPRALVPLYLRTPAIGPQH